MQALKGVYLTLDMGSQMSPEIIHGIVIMGIVVLSFVNKLFPKRHPKEKHFMCSVTARFRPKPNAPLKRGYLQDQVLLPS
jgi:hypothetical protein